MSGHPPVCVCAFSKPPELIVADHRIEDQGVTWVSRASPNRYGIFTMCTPRVPAERETGATK